ncbi:MAG: hypothetical protein COW11_02540 [Candidatus Omnitrophica bacterium CG12_big_fil_rev_8_21_14_0_65_43_15]|uniref:Uncharacterized protein n=1 Tax=Candidatus Taenaricola geysiri TaxID=1974752 RepID=A0A2J0LRX6_9BACT|nr:MAG: hypothetical protein AUJ89_00850 [Candidatus Omnitrophica bacterium CG1_02_43_210]PIV11623.1 MAG: hypothetical protein COS48_05150 [Candidatus Omnitrophica bacterium CG03_land_8_20_14_0_80_43_22]PIW66597.1 MAG: hypothetical protein COW11_02540 [Candidatus Omnitrophica bacterium CG12_big_fil_rev_8_21_14_0_65_43_15]PIW80362.1 MAG: hypothetical protein COZ98_02625 [Candidatus Omnitrophica bacterium CG_4_8_14_3_um_filter_43_15]PIY84146.1 MAG: hypothetical protein COY77_04005 [Candidatus Omn
MKPSPIANSLKNIHSVNIILYVCIFLSACAVIFLLLGPLYCEGENQQVSGMDDSVLVAIQVKDGVDLSAILDKYNIEIIRRYENLLKAYVKTNDLENLSEEDCIVSVTTNLLKPIELNNQKDVL